MKAVFNSSPVIFLSKLNLIEEAFSLFEQNHIPSGVIDEIAVKNTGDGKLVFKSPNVFIREIKQDRFYYKLREVLGKGETEAILLAFDQNTNNDQ